MYKFRVTSFCFYTHILNMEMDLACASDTETVAIKLLTISEHANG